MEDEIFSKSIEFEPAWIGTIVVLRWLCYESLENGEGIAAKTRRNEEHVRAKRTYWLSIP